MKTNDMEIRAATIEMEPHADGSFTGHAVVWDEWSVDLGGFVERFERNAFGDNPTEDYDVRALFNHDANYVMGRTAAQTLSLENDQRGLRVTIDPPQAQWVDELRESVLRGDISGMSFQFGVQQPHIDDEWEKAPDGQLMRTVKVAVISDVSIVTFPAYPQTSVSVRSVIDEMMAMEDHEPDQDLEDQEPDGGKVETPDYSLHRQLLELL